MAQPVGDGTRINARCDELCAVTVTEVMEPDLREFQPFQAMKK